jgi:hypothetical protein
MPEDQLDSEVKVVQCGLEEIENECIFVDRALTAASQDHPGTKLASNCWQDLIALHRTLLHKHHDFFLVSQHPAASPALRKLATTNSMPARMMKHGIYSFLKLLQMHLDESIDYMLAFIYLAYPIITLLYEEAPDFKDIWIECLGNLGRYRMAIEDEDVRDRDTWAQVARSWFTEATDRDPTVGRIYHHFGILARADPLQQMYYYTRSLTSGALFPAARESLEETLLNPILGLVPARHIHALPIDTGFIKAHAMLFLDQDPNDFHNMKKMFLDNLNNHINLGKTKWKERGVYIAVTNLASWFGYGKEDEEIKEDKESKGDEEMKEDEEAKNYKYNALCEVFLHRPLDVAPGPPCQPGTFAHSVRYECCTHVTLNHVLT